VVHVYNVSLAYCVWCFGVYNVSFDYSKYMMLPCKDLSTNGD